MPQWKPSLSGLYRTMNVGSKRRRASIHHWGGRKKKKKKHLTTGQSRTASSLLSLPSSHLSLPPFEDGGEHDFIWRREDFKKKKKRKCAGHGFQSDGKAPEQQSAGCLVFGESQFNLDVQSDVRHVLNIGRDGSTVEVPPFTRRFKR